MLRNMKFGLLAAVMLAMSCLPLGQPSVAAAEKEIIIAR